MKKNIFLELPQDVSSALWSHLVRPDSNSEQAAFLYTQMNDDNKSKVFKHVEWFPVPNDGFVTQSPFHLELTDVVQALVIKRAHDLYASLVEFHFHSGPWPAKFSPSDQAGFREFVPHVWWRLKGRPYLAVVVSRSGFDALIWLTDPTTPRRLDAILTGNQVLKPTDLTPIL